MQGFIGIRVVPEQLALRAIAQGAFLERARHSDELRQLKGSRSTKQRILVTLGFGKPKTLRREGLGSLVLTAGEVCRLWLLWVCAACLFCFFEYSRSVS